MPGVAGKRARAYEHALTWALEAEKLDLPRLSARCERFIVMHWEHLHTYSLQIASLSSPARHCIMMGMFHAWQSIQRCQHCFGNKYRNVKGQHASCPDCSATGLARTTYPSVEDFMSWRTTPGGAS